MQLQNVDITELLKDGRHFAEKRQDRIHIIDSLTGRSIAIYSDPANGGTPITYQEVQNPDGTLTYLQEGMPLVLAAKREVVFNPVTIDLLCQYISQGMGLSKACEQPGMPTYTTLNRWRRQHDWINPALELARRDRAEWHRDQAIEVASKAEGRDSISGPQLRVETHKWAASVDHEKYNPRTKIEATLNAPTQIVIHTGINRDVTPEPAKLPGVKETDVEST